MRFSELGVPLEVARVAILPVPYDLSLSYRSGARLGPKTIIDMSDELELFDAEIGIHPCDIGIGVAEFVPWIAGNAEKSHDLIYEACLNQLRAGRFVVSLGGHHSITHPLVRAHRDFYGDFGVLQFDAHTDLYPDWQGSELSHASPMYRLVENGFNLCQVGLRAISSESIDYQKRKKIASFPSFLLHKDLMIEKIIESLPKKIYITFDFDVLDPSIMPSVGTPLPDGLIYRQIVDIMSAVFAEKEIIGMDFVEFSPNNNFHAEMTACSLVYRAIGLYYLKQLNKNK